MNGGEANGVRLTGAPRSECRSFTPFCNINAVCRQVVPTLNPIEARQRMSDMLQLVVDVRKSPTAMELEFSAPRRQAEAYRTFVAPFL
jgi:hypothetical protein